MKEENLLIFVYGTLRRNCPSGAHHTYLQGAHFLGYGRLQARLFRVSYYPAIVLTSDNHWVIGEVYALRDQAQLANLDSYEECYEECAEEYIEEHVEGCKPKQEYRRVSVCVQMQEQGESLSVWTYLYNRPTDNLAVIASGDFLPE